MAHNFKKGDVVELKSGGPPMTVVNPALEDGRDVYCTWWNAGKHSFDSASFDSEAVKIHVPGV